MHILRAVKGDPYQEVIHPEEIAPFFVNEGTVRLDGIQYPLTAGEFLLVSHSPPEEVQAKQ